MPNRKNTEEGFWARVRKTASGCWEWAGSLDVDGYGRYSWAGKPNAKTHRVAFAIAFLGGCLPDPQQLVCHHCDNRKCVNPAHLYLGTPVSNMNDRDDRNRHIPCLGERNGSSKISTATVVAVRRAADEGVPTAVIANRVGVSPATIRRIVKRKIWNHV